MKPLSMAWLRPGTVTVAGLMLTVMALAGPSRADAQTMDQMKYLFIMVNDLEQAPGLTERPVRLGAEAWYGGDYNRLWMKVHGDASTLESEGDVETQLLFSRMVSPWWDLQAGIRVDHAWGEATRTRPHLAVGIHGHAPYWFKVESSLFVDDDGNVSAEASAGYELLFTQSLILEPEVEIGVAVQDVPEWGIAAGIHDFEVGTRLRYEIKREFAPYVGWVWQRAFGGTADLLRSGGTPAREGSVVFGIRAWY